MRNASGDGFIQVPCMETNHLLTLKVLGSDVSFGVLILVAPKELFQKSSKRIMDILVTQPIIVHCCLMKRKLFFFPIHLFFSAFVMPLNSNKKEKAVISTKSYISNAGPVRWKCLSRNRLVLHTQGEGCGALASTPKFVLQYVKIFYSSCSVLLHASSLYNSNPQIFESVIENYTTKYTFPGELRVMWGMTYLALVPVLFNSSLLKRKSWPSPCS